MEKKLYLIAGVKPSMKRKYINEKKQNQSDFKELNEYANPRTQETGNILSLTERYEEIPKRISKVSPNITN